MPAFYSAEITAAKSYSGWGGACMGTRRTAARILLRVEEAAKQQVIRVR